MGTPLGTRIQGLEKTVIQNLKTTELVEHPRFHHGEIKKLDEPLTLQYKVAEAYRIHGEYYDPLIDIFPLIGILTKQYEGIIEIATGFDEATNVRTIRLKIEHCPTLDVMQFKYDVLSEINRAVCEYLNHPRHR